MKKTAVPSRIEVPPVDGRMVVKMKTYVISAAYGGLALLMFFVIASIWRQDPAAGVWMGAAVWGTFLFFLYGKGISRIPWERSYPFCLGAVLAVMGIFGFCQMEKLRFVPAFDLDAVYGGAIEWVETGSFPDYYDYFDWFPNNLGGLCFLYLVFRVCGIFTGDYFLAAACVNELLILLTVLFISLSARKLWGSGAGVLALGMTAGILPFWFMADAFYTDSLSLLFPVLAFYLFLEMEEGEGAGIPGKAVLMGAVISLGALIKPTVLIMAVAAVLALVLNGKWKRAGICAGAVGIFFLVLTGSFRLYIYGRHLDPALAEWKNTPSLHWIMMGLEGDGGYNPADYEFTRSFGDPVRRDEALLREIGSRIREKGAGGMLQLYSAKLSRCFGDGTLGLSDFLDDTPMHETGLHRYLLYEGAHHDRYRRLCNVFLRGYLLLGALFLVRRIRPAGRQLNSVCYVGGLTMALALGGMAVFLMHWETSPRYITNFVPVMVLLAVGGVCLEYEKDT